MKKLTLEQKHIVSDALKNYKESNKFSLPQIGKVIGGIDSGTVSKIINKKFLDDKQVQVGDGKYISIAKYLGVDIYGNKKLEWRKFNTCHLEQVKQDLQDAKEYSIARSIIGQTGFGKTYSINEFQKENANSTYIITCANDFTIRDFVMEIAEKVGLSKKDREGTQAKIRKRIQKKLKREKEAGGKPILIFDELENLKLPSVGRIKALYDNLKGECGFVFVATPDWFYKLKNWNDKSKNIAPQIFSRFVKRKLTDLSDVSIDIDKIFEDLGIGCKDFKKAIKDVINKEKLNYRDIADIFQEMFIDINKAFKNGEEKSLDIKLFNEIY